MWSPLFITRSLKSFTRELGKECPGQAEYFKTRACSVSQYFKKENFEKFRKVFWLKYYKKTQKPSTAQTVVFKGGNDVVLIYFQVFVSQFVKAW